MMRAAALLVTFILISAAANGAEIGYYSQPALYGDRLVFVSEGDLWTAEIPAKETAEPQPIIAHRLTSGDGTEARPSISPDGQWIAFTAQYDGNPDVYVMPIDGGPPKRLTFHPDADIALGWTPDGQYVLFSSPRAQHFGRPELWRVPAAGGAPTRYEFGECSMISMSPSGKRAAFTRWSNENWTWKRYRGGTAPEIWVGDLLAGNFTQLTNNTASDLFPMWILDRVFFLSDRTGTANIFSDSPDAGAPGKDLKQHTKFSADANNPTAIEGYDARWPSADAKRRGTRIVFCQAGALALIDITNDSVRRLDVRLASDRTAARQRFAPVGETLTEFSLSPDGKTLLVGSRGEILSMPVEPGVIQQITHTSNAREWGVNYLGKDQLVMISDAAGEQQIVACPADGSAAPGLVTHDREAWLFPPATSPNGKWIAFADKTLRLHVIDMTTLDRRQIDQSEAGEITDYRFSPDSEWLAYTKPMPNAYGMVYMYSLRTGRSFPISQSDKSGLYNDSEPRWDPAGKYLYFLSQRYLNPVIGSLDMEHVFINTTEIYAVSLAADTPPPLKIEARAAGFDLEKWATPAEKSGDDQGGDNEDKADKPKKTEKAAIDKKADKRKKADEAVPAPDPAAAADPDAPKPIPGAVEPMRVDTDGIALRQVRLPIEPGNYSDLEALWGSLTYLANPVQGLMDDHWPMPASPEAALHRHDLVKEEDKVIAQKVAGYVINEQRSAIAYPLIGEENKVMAFAVIDPATAGAAEEATAAEDKSIKKVEIASQQLRTDIRAEWGQILAEAWRLQRDFFWAPNYVGVNWTAMKTKYEALLPRVGTRNELNDLIGQMIGELGNSHTYVFGGEQSKELKPVAVGLLGADIEFDGKGFRIVRIVPGQPWGEEKYNSPLEQSFLGVKQGNYLLAINGMQLAPSSDVNELLQDKAEKRVRLTIADDPFGANTRNIEIKTLADEHPLRYAAWVENNRRYVEEKSGGKLGYVHIPDMGGDGLAMFSRFYYPQYIKQGMVIDIRNNGGGFVSQMIISRLGRKVWAFDQPRQGMTERYPQKTLYGYMDVIIDEHAGSDGDIFPESFRMLNLGPLIGMRTWGGVVGIRGDKPFVDLGLSTQPEFAWWEPKAGWAVENVGVAPDIEVDDTPADRAAGRDPQLDKAIDVLLQKLKDQPMDIPKPPPWPVRMPGSSAK